MIALKREVATWPRGLVGFPWSECQGPWVSSHVTRDEEPDDKSLYQNMSASSRNTGVKRTIRIKYKR